MMVFWDGSGITWTICKQRYRRTGQLHCLCSRYFLLFKCFSCFLVIRFCVIRLLQLSTICFQY